MYTVLEISADLEELIINQKHFCRIVCIKSTGQINSILTQYGNETYDCVYCDESEVQIGTEFLSKSSHFRFEHDSRI